MADSLKVRTVRALSWSFVQELALRALQLCVSLFLARILAPKEFGLLAILTVFIGFAQTLVEGGFASALIQAKQPTEAHRCSVFYFNILTSVLLAGILWGAAPIVATFYEQQLLRNLLRVLALVPVINAVGLVQNALLTRNLDFRKQTGILVASTIISGCIAMTLACHGFGVWSLVIQQVTQSLVRAVLLWCLSPWRPKWLFRLNALGEMFRFGWGMLGSAILASVYDNLYPLLIGKFFSTAHLGYYSRAQSLQCIASQSLGAIANRVTFPVFSALQDDVTRFRNGLRKAMTTITFVQFPMMVGLAVVAKPLVLLILTDKWADSIPYLQLLAFAGMLHPLHVLNLNVLLALGRSDLFFRLEVFKVCIFFGMAVLTFRWGIMAMIWGQILCGLVAYFLNSHFTKKLIGYSVLEQLRDLYPCLAASIVMGLLVTFFSPMLPSDNVLQLSFRVTFGVFVYLSICRSFGAQTLHEVVGLVLRRATAPA